MIFVSGAYWDVVPWVNFGAKNPSFVINNVKSPQFVVAEHVHNKGVKKDFTLFLCKLSWLLKIYPWSANHRIV